MYDVFDTLSLLRFGDNFIICFHWYVYKGKHWFMEIARKNNLDFISS